MASPLPLAKLYYLQAYNAVQWFGWYLSFLPSGVHRSINPLPLMLRNPGLSPPCGSSGKSCPSNPPMLLTPPQEISSVTCKSFPSWKFSTLQPEGLVPSGVMTALMQWGGRTHFLLAIVRQIPEVQRLPSVFITFVAWSVSEIIRYAHYVASGMGICPSWLNYLRYTAFIVLYPIGVGPGEMWLMYEALPFIKKKNLYSHVFNKFYVTYYSFVTVLLLCYPLLWWKLYLHLFRQRRQKLRKDKKNKDA